MQIATATEVADLEQSLQTAVDTFAQGRVIREGFRVALAGPPNAGKSSLLNALSETDAAIVTDEAGTTRDVKEVALELAGRLVILVDMAGLRETESKAEAEGVRRAQNEILSADLVLWLIAPDVEPYPAPDASAPVWQIRSKADLGDGDVSVVSGEGLSDLLSRLAQAASEATAGESVIVSRERDVAALTEAIDALATIDLARQEVAAEALRQAGHSLGRLIGTVDSEMVLDRLFSSFCIGK